MFAWWGRTVYRFRFAVIGVMVALCVGGGVYGISLGQHVTQSGFYDEGSQSVHASLAADAAYGRDTSGHIIAIYTAPEGKTVDDPAFQKKVLDNLANVEKEHPDQILRSIGYFKSPELLKNMADDDKKHAFMSVQLKGDNDDSILNNYNKNVGNDGTTVKEALNIPGVEVQQAGLQPLASELTGTIGEDQKRAEVAAIPLVCVVLFFVFGGVIAAALPGIIGGLTIAGALGVMRLAAEFIPVHFFAQPVVTLMGLGIAVDYGLFMVSRFREELAEGYDTEAAIRRTVMTSGRTVMFSAVILVASSVPLLLFPQGFLKSITYAIIASVMIAAILSVTVLAAALAILGPRVDALGVKTLVKFAEPDPIESDPANPKINTFAIASIPLGLLFPPVGIALGHIARKRMKETGEQGANLALIGQVLGYTALYGAMTYGIIAMKDADIIGSAIYWMLLGIVIFLVIVTFGLALARYVPLARTPIVWWLHWLAEKTQKTKTRAEVEKGFWGKLVNHVMKRPIAFAAPIVIFMIILIIPLGQLALGGISEKYLPPDNSVRVAQEEFDKTFPGFRTEPLTMVIESDNGDPVTDQQVADVRGKAMTIPGFIETNNDPTTMWKERSYLDGASKDPSVRVIQNGLLVRNDAAQKIAELRAIAPPRGLTVSVGGTPALEQDSIHSLFDKLPLMVVLLITTTTILMFLAFGSVVLPIKAALMSALTLGSTMGILTWMFVDGHGAGLMNYTPQPLMAPMIGLIIAVIWGLSTDYEVFLVSRMVEARERGMSTAEAIRIGTATTGRLITGAALVLAVVAGAFVFSDLVMMKYLAFGLLIALLLDATIVRMFLVPAIMKLLGDDCWWAPRWMKRLQERLGLGETELPDERKRPTVREPEEALVGAGAAVPPARPLPPHDPGHPGGPGPRGPGRPPAPPRAVQPSAVGTTRIPTAAAPQTEAPTTRFTAPKDASPANAAAPTTRTPRVNPNRAATPPAAPVTPPPPSRGARRAEPRGSAPNREIESWLGELRGGNGGTAAPSADPTRAMPEQRTRKPQPPVGNEPTTAIPAQRPQDADATEKIDTREAADEPKRRGGGMSAADLLRREGRL
ncbi:MMPL family transporter [Mycobacterium sp. URHB0044]|uniref:MMPL family transporter n=1 Tax=Mycobacterium sp. URHB0044 TaxID=1380386 RepID=UPI00048C7733|nr:MMPL family transporter [Mycobacterium sp. URHB0044]